MLGCGVAFICISWHFVSLRCSRYNLFFETRDFFVVYGPVLLILVIAYVGCGCKRRYSFWSSMWDHLDDLEVLLSKG